MEQTSTLATGPIFGVYFSDRDSPPSQDRANEVGRHVLMMRSVRPAVFLDSDGVLNHAIARDGKPDPPRDLP
jgi:hypothetical protein